MKITFIGHVCRDLNVIRGEPATAFGGGVLHGSITAQRLGAETSVLTKCAAKDRRHFDFLGAAGVRTVFLESETTTSIRNDYPTENPDDRVSTLVARAAPFAEADLDAISADFVHVNPLWLGEMPDALLPALRQRVAWLSVDAQGFLRKPGPEGRLEHCDWAKKQTFLPLLDAIKVDQREAAILTGEAEYGAALKKLHAFGARLVVLTHKGGVVVSDGRATHEGSFGAYTLEGRTGRGDTCMSAFLVARAEKSLAEAARFAAKITTEKMQYPGPYRGAR